MLTSLIVAQILSWIVILVLGTALLALARQVGVLHMRVAPAGALTTAGGVEVGDKSGPIAAQTLGQRQDGQGLAHADAVQPDQRTGRTGDACLAQALADAGGVFLTSLGAAAQDHGCERLGEPRRCGVERKGERAQRARPQIAWTLASRQDAE